MPLFTSKDRGDVGESLALTHLQRAGLTLLQRNFRCHGGEIDLVMREQNTLVLVEVRWRTGMQFGGAAASITMQKQQRLRVAATRLLQQHREYQELRVRFDVVAIQGEPEGTSAKPRVEWIKDAFRCS